MKEKLEKKEFSQEFFDRGEDLDRVLGGKKGEEFKVFKGFAQREAQKKWIDLMGIPKD